ncbi:MAG: hypothetical protein AB1916_12370 [Thermodesulfobacteriota bacterium]
MKPSDDLEGRVLLIFGRVFRRTFNGGPIRAKEIEEWDSLSHIHLVMALELEFGLDIDPDSVGRLYSDSEAVLDYLRTALSGGRP